MTSDKRGPALAGSACVEPEEEQAQSRERDDVDQDEPQPDVRRGTQPFPEIERPGPGREPIAEPQEKFQARANPQPRGPDHD